MTEPQVDPKSNRKKLWGGLISEGLYTKSYEEFEKKYSDPEAIKLLYDGLKEEGGIQSTEPDAWQEKYFSDLLKKKVPSSFPEVQTAQQVRDGSPLPHPSLPSGETSSEGSPALTAEDKIRSIHKEFSENKHGAPAPEKTAFQIHPEFKKALMDEAVHKSDSLSKVYQHKFDLQADAIIKKYSSEASTGKLDPEEAQAKADAEIQALQAQQEKIMRDQEEIEWTTLASKYEGMSREKTQKNKPKKDAGFVESAGKQAYNVFANQLPSTFAAADSEKLPSIDVKPREDGSLRFNAEEWGVGSNVDTRLIDNIVALEGRIDSGENLSNVLADESLHPDVRQALTETIGNIKGKANKDVIKSTFAFMMNRQMGRRRKHNLDEINKQQQESAELLDNVPLSWKEAQEDGNLAGYVGGALGQGLGSSVAASSMGLVVGAKLMEQGEAYSTGLQAKAQRRSKEWGIQVTPEMIALNNDDQDVIETAATIGTVNAGLEVVGTIFGFGKMAASVFRKKLAEQIVKRSFGKQFANALVGAATSVAAEGGTEAIQSMNTIAGAKKLAGAKYGTDVYSNLIIASVNRIIGRKVEKGQSLDDAAAGITEEEADEIIESARQGAIAGGLMGAVGDFTTLAKSGRQMYIDKKRGAAISRAEAEAKIEQGDKDIEVINDPALSAKMEKFQIGITSATDQDTDVKILMDIARASREEGNFEQAEEAYNKVLDIGEKKINETIAKVPGVKIQMNRTKGDFFHYTEPTFVLDAEVPQDKIPDFLASVAGASEDLQQFNAHVSQVRHLKLGQQEQYGIEDADGWVNEPNVDILFSKPLSEQEFQDLTNLIEDEEGLAGFTLHPDKKGINLYNVSKFQPYEEFVGKVTKLKKALDARGDGPRFKASVRRLLNIGRPEYGATRTYEQVRGKVYPKQEVKPISAEERTRIEGVLGKAKKSLSKLIPDLNVVYYTGTEEGSAAIKRVDPNSNLDPDANGFFHKNTIGIDLSRADEGTAFHEAFHPIIDAVRAQNPEVFESLANQAAQSQVLLEDGNYVKFLDYAGGNKEEALVEFLADFAQRKGTQKKGVIETVKGLINSLLEAIGLKSSDLKIDLDNVKDLKKFAGDLANAMSKGKAVDIKGGTPATAGAKFQKRSALGKRATPARKLNRTAAKILGDPNTEFKQQQQAIQNDRDAYSYDPMKFSDIDQFLESKTDLELDSYIVPGNNMAVLAGIKLMRRLNKKGLDTDIVFRKLREIGTTSAQLVRSFGELKYYAPHDIVKMVEKSLQIQNRYLTTQNRNELTGKAQVYTKAQMTLDNAKEDFKKNPNNQTGDKLDKAEKDLDEAYKDLTIFIGKITPVGIDSMIAMILQGNLLTTQSIVTNPAGNIFQMASRFPELLAGDLAMYAANRGWRHEKGVMKVLAPLEIFFGSMFRGAKGWALGWPTAIKDIITGYGNQNASALEVKRQLRPLQAWHQLFFDRKSLPVNEKGKIPFSAQLEKALEGTGGATAEVMFRLLYLGDKPFRNAAKEAATYRLFRESGGRSSTEYRNFINNLTPEQKAKIEHSMNEATMSDDRTLAKWADKGVKFLIEGADSFFGDSTFSRTLSRVLVKANIPFVRVPSNIAQQMVEYILFPLSFYGSYRYARKGDVRKSTALFVRGLVGASMHYMANMLFDAGVLIASGEGDDENERQLKFEVGRPNGINISALGRYKAGIQDPNNPFLEGDKVIGFDRFGVPGLFLAYNAEWNEELKRSHPKKSRAEISVVDKWVQRMGSATKTFMEAPFLHGSYVGLQALSKGDLSGYFADLGNTLTVLSPLHTNQRRAVTSAMADHVLRADDPSTWRKFLEKQSIKNNPDLKDNIEGVYPIIGMFGETIQPSPGIEAGSIDSFVYQFFNITKSKTIRDPKSIEVYNLWMRTGNLQMSHPSPNIRLGDDEGMHSMKMHEKDYVYAQMLAGEIKSTELGMEMSTPEWKTYTDEEKLLIMKAINESANETAKSAVLAQIYEGVEDGEILLDEEKGTYKYTQPTQFDFDYAKKTLTEEGN